MTTDDYVRLGLAEFLAQYCEEVGIKPGGDSMAFPDDRDLAHLNAFLEREVRGESNQAFVREAMLTLAAEDPEYWMSRNYWDWIAALPQPAQEVARGVVDLVDVAPLFFEA
jgi:hypothetical protein